MPIVGLPKLAGARELRRRRGRPHAMLRIVKKAPRFAGMRSKFEANSPI
jgi:hypothetical protein